MRNPFTKSILIAGASVCIFLSSCVSSRKYKDLQASQQNCEQLRSQCLSETEKLSSQVSSLTNDYNNLQKEKDLLASQSSDALSQKEKELRAKENELTTREKQIIDLRAKLNEQKEIVNNLKNKVSAALVGYKPEELTVEIRDGKVYVSLADQLLFPSGSDKVNAKGAEAIKKLAEVLAKNNDSSISVYIEGHTDTIPINTAKFTDNWDLSVHRATSIIRILTENGLSPQQIIASGRGEYFPVASNSTPEGRQLNRRTEIILSPKLDELYNLLDQ